MGILYFIKRINFGFFIMLYFIYVFWVKLYKIKSIIFNKIMELDIALYNIL